MSLRAWFRVCRFMPAVGLAVVIPHAGAHAQQPADIAPNWKFAGKARVAEGRGTGHGGRGARSPAQWAATS